MWESDAHRVLIRLAASMVLSACSDRALDDAETMAEPLDRCEATEGPFPEVEVSFTPEDANAELPMDATCTVELDQRRPDGAAITLACSWGTATDGIVEVSWATGDPVIPAELRRGNTVRADLFRPLPALFPDAGTGIRLRATDEEGGYLLLLLTRGSTVSPFANDSSPYAPLSLGVVPGGCPTVKGECFARNFIGDLTVFSDDAPDQDVEPIAPFSMARHAGYRIHTGALRVPDPDSKARCPGPGPEDMKAELFVIAE